MKALAERRPVGFDEARGDKQGPIARGRRRRRRARSAPPRRRRGHERRRAPQNGSKTRVVVVGDSDFAANGFLGVQGNRNLFLNTVNWLAQQENLISIRPSSPTTGASR